MSEIKPLDREQWKKLAVHLQDENETLRCQLAELRSAARNVIRGNRPNEMDYTYGLGQLQRALTESETSDE